MDFLEAPNGVSQKNDQSSWVEISKHTTLVYKAKDLEQDVNNNK